VLKNDDDDDELNLSRHDVDGKNHVWYLSFDII
jgi:hypothetical protein